MSVPPEAFVSSVMPTRRRDSFCKSPRADVGFTAGTTTLSGLRDERQREVDLLLCKNVVVDYAHDAGMRFDCCDVAKN
jgi:hypothetical protein